MYKDRVCERNTSRDRESKNENQMISIKECQRCSHRREKEMLERVNKNLLELLAKKKEIAEIRMRNCDPMTGLLTFEAMLDKHQRKNTDTPNSAVSNNRRSMSEATTVVFIDINNFKGINDQCGHKGGDDAIVYFAKILTSSARGDDTIGICRNYTAGDEFCIIIEGDEAAAGVFIERVRANLTKNPFSFKRKKIPFSVAAGIAQQTQGEKLNDTLSRADKNMYKDKGNIFVRLWRKINMKMYPIFA